MNKLITKSINVLKSLYTNEYINNKLQQYGLNPVIHSHWTTLIHNTYNSAVINHFGFRTAECLYRSHFLMERKARAYCSRINRYYITQQLYPTNNKHHIIPYAILISGKDSRPTDMGINYVIDKNNNKPSYQLYNQLHKQIIKKINKMPRITFLLGRTENAWHISRNNHIYSHVHRHGLILSNSTLANSKLMTYIKSQFIKIFGYKPVHLHIQQLYKKVNNTKIKANKLDLNNQINIIDKFINYLSKDYKLQTKDTNFDFFNNSKRLSHNQRSLAFYSQLEATQSLQIVSAITNNKINKAIKYFLNGNLAIIYELTHQITKNYNLQLTLIYKKNGFNSKNNSHNFKSNNIKYNQNKIQQPLMWADTSNIVINKRSSGVPP